MDDDERRYSQDQQAREQRLWLGDEVDGLTLDQVHRVLHWLVGYDPDLVEKALARVRHPAGGPPAAETSGRHVPLRIVVPEQLRT